MKITAHLSFEEASENTHVFGVFQAENDKGAPQCSHDEFEDVLGRLSKEDVFKGKKGSVYFVRAPRTWTSRRNEFCVAPPPSQTRFLPSPHGTSASTKLFVPQPRRYVMTSLHRNS